MATHNEVPDLSVSDFTEAARPLIEFLKHKYHDEPLRISDVWDNPRSVNPQLDISKEDETRQYIDLVQEGGGVHGVALTGFTYVLEKMGISFMKMAGTSAGAINTMLLSCLYNKREAALLGRPVDMYYETRSEKLLEYLSKKKLTDLVDGIPKWQKLIKKLFSGDVNFEPIKKYVSRIRFAFKTILVAIGMLLLVSLMVLFLNPPSGIVTALKIGAGLGIILLLVPLIYLYLQYRDIRHLRQAVKKELGINPGKDFENWLTVCMVENGIHSIQDLRKKLEKEEAVLGYRYKPVILETPPTAARGLFESSVETDPEQSMLQSRIADPEYSISSIKRSYRKMASRSLFESTDTTPSHEDQYAFAKRTENFVRDQLHKEIVIVAADVRNEIKVEFPGMHNMYWGEDMSVSPAHYVRASMSIPIFFVPLKVAYNALQSAVITSEWSKYLAVQKAFKDEDDIALFVDGGLLSNFPLNVFYNPEMPLPSRPTIGIKLEYEDETVPNDIRTERGLLGSLVSTMRYFYDRDFINKHNMYKKTVRSIDTGKVHWLNFSLSAEEQLELFYRGALTAVIFLAKITRESPELKDLINAGKQIKFNGKTFSIFSDDDIFKTEDLLIPGISFDWEKYKIDRINDALSAKPEVLREHAMLH